MKLKEFISKPFSAISEWCKAHESFIAVKLTRILAVGFIIGVIQDSVETALNSSGDVMFAATAEFHDRMKRGEEVKF